jgi:membrane-associated phospholipid phosphatase
MRTPTVPALLLLLVCSTVCAFPAARAQQPAAVPPASMAVPTSPSTSLPAPLPAPTAIRYPKKHSKLKTLFWRTLGDAKAYYTAPLHWNREDWEYFGGALAAIAVAHHYDTQVRTHFDAGSPLPDGPHPGASTDITDALPAAALFLGTWSYAHLVGSHTGDSEAWNMLEAAGLSFVSAYAIKYVVRRERPYQTRNPNAWFSGGDSFPSEHATAAFAIGTVFAETGNPRYLWIRRTIGYGIAAYTAYLRLKANAHWLSDTVAGAALGMATAHFVMDRRAEGKMQDSTVAVVPVRGGVMLAASVQFQ